MTTLLDKLTNGKKVINVFTDLEPDDIIAITLLENYNKAQKNKYKFNYIVGEGDSLTKTFRMEKLLQILNENLKKYDNIFQGFDSDKKYESDGFELLETNNFFKKINIDHNLEKDFYKNLEWYSKFELDNKNKLFTSQDNLEYDSKNKSKIYMDHYKTLHKEADFNICLKPPRELIKLWKNIDIDLSNKTVAIYGSFNIRCLMKKYSKDNIIDFLNSFKETYLYETYHMTDNNSFFSPLLTKEKMSGYILRNIYFWNLSIYVDCLESIQKRLPGFTQFDEIEVDCLELSETDKQYVSRNYKVLKNIQKNYFQFVNADTGLVALLLLPINDSKPLPIDNYFLSFNQHGYTQLESDDKNEYNLKVFKLKGKFEEEKEKEIMEYYLQKQTEIFNKYLVK